MHLGRYPSVRSGVETHMAKGRRIRGTGWCEMVGNVHQRERPEPDRTCAVPPKQDARKVVVGCAGRLFPNLRCRCTGRGFGFRVGPHRPRLHRQHVARAPGAGPAEQGQFGRSGMSPAPDIPVPETDAGSDETHETFLGSAALATGSDACSNQAAIAEDAQSNGWEGSDSASDQVPMTPADAGSLQPTDSGDMHGDAFDTSETGPGSVEEDRAASREVPMEDARFESVPDAETELSGETGDSAGPDVEHPDGPDCDTDLMSIPGAGPGLIWMFSKASVRSLDDLAKADAEDLTAALGPVGQILDVAQLIDFARQHTERAE